MYNKITLVGHLAEDPDIQKTAKGYPVINLKIITSTNWKNPHTLEIKHATETHRVTAFSECATTAETLKKGALVFIGGRLKTTSFENAQGVRHATVGVQAENIMILKNDL